MPSVTGPGESGPEALGGCETATSGTQNNNIEASDSDHVIARSNGGSDRASNLVPACVPCNQNQTAADIQAVLAKDQWINHDQSRFKCILTQAKQPLKDAAAVNATRWALDGALQSLGWPVSAGTGGPTKWNRHRFFITKTDALDAVCVGNMDTGG
jgi:hypothetical protein